MIEAESTIIYHITVVDVTSITILETQTLTVGDTYTFSPVIIPTTAKPTLTWMSSNPSVASVSDGKVTALSEGTTTITCMANNGVSASCEVTVKPVANCLTIADVRGSVGANVTLPVSMRNEEVLTAFQFEVSLPEGITLSDCQLTDRKSNDHLISFSQLSNGNYQVLAFSVTSKAFSGADGTVANLTLHVGESVAKGTYDVGIKNIELTTPDETALTPAGVSARLTVSDVLMGDTNGDGRVTITDAVAVVNYILGQASSRFVGAAADVNGDGKTTITDAVAIVNIILNNQ